MRWNCAGFRAAKIAEAGAPIRLRIAIQNFLPITAVRHADSIVMPRNGSEIENSDDDLISAFGLSHEAQHALLRVASVDPFEACGIAVEFVQRPFGTIGAIQIRNPAPKTTMRIVLQQMPFETVLVYPFAPLAELTAHKQQLFRRLRVHVRKQEAQVRKLLPEVTWHFSQERSFSVHHFVMR